MTILSQGCSSQEPDRLQPTTTEDAANPKQLSLLGFYGFCDMGPARTPILLDHHWLIPNALHDDNDDIIDDDDDDEQEEATKFFLPCHFHTREGVRITSLTQLVDAMFHITPQFSAQQDNTNHQTINNNSNHDNNNSCVADHHQHTTTTTLHLYAVPAGRMFMFAPSFVGETFVLSHVTGAGGNSSPHVSLQVLSLTPRVFELHHFFTRDESTELIERALQETRETHRIKRSSTGATGYNVNPQRTSESGYDTSGTTAVAIMQYVTTKMKSLSQGVLE